MRRICYLFCKLADDGLLASVSVMSYERSVERITSAKPLGASFPLRGL